MKHTLFTLGYQQRTLGEFTAILRRCDIDVLIDVRETAWSHKPGFSKGALERALEAEGIAYVHAAFAGNPKWLRANADSHRECLERHADDCHRAILAEQWQERGPRRVEHLATEGCERLVTA